MTLRQLQQQVCRANLEIVRRGLVVETWGNVSGVDRERGCLVIKPSGVDYAALKPEAMVVVALRDGAVLGGNLRPSSDTPTHRHLYNAWETLGGVVHTHSLFATAWSQAQRAIPALGTTHADYWHGPVPCTRELTKEEIAGPYEENTGRVLVECLGGRDPLTLPGALIASHGPFAWGSSLDHAVANATVLEFVARLASETERLRPRVPPMKAALLDRHFLRKHGATAYYGQGTGGPAARRPTPIRKRNP